MTIQLSKMGPCTVSPDTGFPRDVTECRQEGHSMEASSGS